MTPESSVILCSVPRSGSTLLCDLLTATGVCGTVQSYFRRLSIDNWITRFGLDIARSDPDFASVFYQAALTAGSDSSGSFGLRMMWDNVPELSAWLDELFPGLSDDRARIAAAFGPPDFVFLTRRDKVAQAGVAITGGTERALAMCGPMVPSANAPRRTRTPSMT